MNYYENFFKYYDNLASVRPYFLNQSALVQKLFKDSNKKILDASCGTGLNISALKDCGHTVFANDGSSEMLKILKLKNISYDKITNYAWIDLEQLFQVEHDFDLIYFLGNSIAHCDSLDYLRKVMEIVRFGLKKDGIFMFDTRHWEFNTNSNQYWEPSRKINKKKLISPESDKNLLVYDECKYINDKQIISYSIVEGKNQKQIDLEYLILYPDLVYKLLYESGFSKIECFDFRDDAELEYPYIIYKAQ